MPNDRAQKLGIVLQPWKHEGEYVLICGQHGHSEQWRNMRNDMDTYYRNTITEIRKHTDKPIVVRSHPRFRENLHWTCNMVGIESEATGIYLNMYNKHEDSFDLEHAETYILYSKP